MAKKRELRLPALQVKQGPKRMLYVFSVDGKLVHRFATISRVRRDEEGALRGYQRPEVFSHIDEIRRFIEGPNPMIPNAVVLAFNSSVHFEPADTEFHPEGYSRTGTLRVPFEEEMLDEDKPAFVVDGQQRLAAVRDSNVDSFPLSVVAFITDDVAEQTDQFILVNSTKPLAKGLVYELLPNTESRLPSNLLKKRFPSQLLTILNAKRHSPFRGLIQTPTNPSGIIKDNSILKMLETSLNEGVLYRFRSEDGAGGAIDAMVTVLCAYWGAVSDVFPDDWRISPKKSRLMHGAGIQSMGLLMDAIADRHRNRIHLKRDMFALDLMPLKRICRWTSGFWDFGAGRKVEWNQIENTHSDIRQLSQYLLDQYNELVRDANPPSDRRARGG
ncbi:DGQHR domain-containing protein DpdB [Hyalangium minutum]|uniref:TgtA5 cluster protein 1 n=1 Tax=Hyalangium minutum TaxID=394096 RepID=A0A085WRD1_9BACT|nr:DGQHR domain-containing protein DpdB [Hyalangium minutum]KFE70244.1 tgtA5 cluster protein 1 [Hyalangium minutum]